MGLGASKTSANSGVNSTGAGAPPAVNLSSMPTNNSKRNATYNAMNKQMVDNVRKAYGRPNMPVKEAMNLSAVPTADNMSGIPRPIGGGRRKTARKSKKAKKSKKGNRK